MSDRKHIDRLFQEKLKDFEVAPNDSIWESIESKLHQKKRKRRVIPLWWQMAGVAAILAVLFIVGGIVFDDANENKPTSNSVVNTDEKDKSSDPSSETNTISNKNPEENVVIDGANEELLNSDNANTVVNQVPNNATAIANTTSNTDKTGTVQNTKSLANQALNNPKNSNVVASNTKANDGINSSNLPELNQNNIDNGQKESEMDTQVYPVKSDVNTSIANVQSKEEISELNKEITEKEPQTIEDAIVQVNNIDKKEEEKKLSRWNISTNVAPVYFNSIGNGSSLDEQFNGNSKSGEINMSYGINGSYAINEKLKIRAGINKVNLGYNTNDVLVYNGVDTPLIGVFSRNNSNIDFIDKTGNTSILSAQNLSFAAAPEIMASNVTASLNQELGFIEFPVEIEYSILNKKLGLNIISGFSALFLENNQVYSTLNKEKTFLGEANNINDTSYSANFGLGLNYNISEKIKFNLEPTFKYQINTFQDTSGNFRPYFIGIYTGLSYKF